MPLNLDNFQGKAQSAIRKFWKQRDSASRKNKSTGKGDQGERSSVTAGKNMDGFVELVVDIVRSNGLTHADFHINKKALTLPGYFRPTKKWDLLVMHKERLVAAIEFKSHVGPSFGNNFNNRTEEAIGTATDFWTAYREGAFGHAAPQPFIGWLMLLEDAPASRRSGRLGMSPHFPVMPEFTKASYARRYELLCEKLVSEKLYTSTALLLSGRDAVDTGAYSELGTTSGLKQFLSRLAAFSADEATR